MGIDGIKGNNGPAEIHPTGAHSKHLDKTKSKPAQQEDRVTLSDRKQEFARIRQMVDQTPDVQSNRVEQLAQAIDSGTYKVNSEDVADALIQKNWNGPTS
jgi:flagellar biosynthesis anti-sigma factor FlgM